MEPMSWGDLYASGRTLQSIADEVGISYWRVRAALLKVGVKMRPTGQPVRITPEERKERLCQKSSRQYHAKSEAICALCGEPLQDLCVDHNHETGKVRGLLHIKCNGLLAAIENTTFLEAAKAYLSRYE